MIHVIQHVGALNHGSAQRGAAVRMCASQVSRDILRLQLGFIALYVLKCIPFQFLHFKIYMEEIPGINQKFDRP